MESRNYARLDPAPPFRHIYWGLNVFWTNMVTLLPWFEEVVEVPGNRVPGFLSPNSCWLDQLFLTSIDPWPDIGNPGMPQWVSTFRFEFELRELSFEIFKILKKTFFCFFVLWANQSRSVIIPEKKTILKSMLVEKKNKCRKPACSMVNTKLMQSVIGNCDRSIVECWLPADECRLH